MHVIERERSIVVDSDRHRNGPYAVAQGVLQILVPEALACGLGHLVQAHDIEIRATTPVLHALVPARRISLAASVPASERILIPGAGRTLRLAHGVTEFVRGHLRQCGPRRLIVKNYAHADQTDRELLTVMRRRIGNDLLQIDVADDHRGADTCAPEHVPITVLMSELDRYRQEGFHHRLAEVGQRVFPRLSHAEDPDTWWWFLHRVAGALTAIKQEAAARALYDESRRISVDPCNRATAAYATAMLLVRHHDHARRDPDAALAWINEALAITCQLPANGQRAFHFSFDLNGKALVELRRGRASHALALVEQAIQVAAEGLGEGQHVIHQLILRSNRGRLMQRLGRLDEALAELDHVVEADPGNPDYHLDRAQLLRELGRPHDALADLDAAIALGLPSPQTVYNRGDLLLTLGEMERAAADLDYAIELDPTFTAAYIDRAGLRVDVGDLQGARDDIEQTSQGASAICVRAQIELAQGRPAQARNILDEVLSDDHVNATAWAIRAAAAFAEGDLDDAIDDLAKAIAIEPTPAFLFNRAIALEAAGRPDEAVHELERAVQLDPTNADLVLALDDMRRATASSQRSGCPLPIPSRPDAS